jgi:ketosteroid isomerase-like protein
VSQEAEIRAVIDRYADAVLANDIQTALDCYAEDIVLH